MRLPGLVGEGLTFILRILYVVCILLLLGMMYASWLESLRYSYGPQGRIYQNTSNIQPLSMARFAYQFFLVFVMFQYGVAAFLTPAYVAGTIADEKERKTLEFLLATDLQPREIIFGKVAARVTNLIMYVLAGLPIIAFLQLFGGIEPDLVLATSAATIITILGFAGISIYFSTIMRKPRDAIVMSYMTIGFLPDCFNRRGIRNTRIANRFVPWRYLADAQHRGSIDRHDFCDRPSSA